MLYPVKKKLVNWADGMKISKDHFVQTEDFYIDSIRDIASVYLNNHNFGLLPPYKGERLSSNFEINERITNYVEIELRLCNAITPGGCRIDINPIDHTEYLKLDHRFEEKEEKDGKECLLWDIILVVRPFNRIPVGIPDPEETPPRHPNIDKTYELYVKPSGEITVDELGMHHLIIGRISKEGNRYIIDSSYIPPCTSMSSHPDLKNYYELFGKYLNDIEISSQKIIQKILERENNPDIARYTEKICEHLLIYISGIYFKYKNSGRYQTPVEIVNTFSSLAHTCYVSLSFMSKAKREELLQYYYEWADITPGTFLEILADLVEIKYDHQDIRTMMARVEKAMSTLSSLWVRLSTLEYVGQRKENIVVAEKSQKIETGPRQSEWTILD